MLVINSVDWVLENYHQFIWKLSAKVILLIAPVSLKLALQNTSSSQVHLIFFSGANCSITPMSIFQHSPQHQLKLLNLYQLHSWVNLWWKRNATIISNQQQWSTEAIKLNKKHTHQTRESLLLISSIYQIHLLKVWSNLSKLSSTTVELSTAWFYSSY
jgi:hypothetical protein